MKKNKSDFKHRYGADWKGVMYATATKMAKEDVDGIPAAILEAAAFDAEKRYEKVYTRVQSLYEQLGDLLRSHRDKAGAHTPLGVSTVGPGWGHVADMKTIEEELETLFEMFTKPVEVVEEEVDEKTLMKLLSEATNANDSVMHKIAHRLAAKFPIDVVETISKRIHDSEQHQRLMTAVNDILASNKTLDLGSELITEKYIGFKKLAKKVGPKVAAFVGRKKYGKKKFQKAAAEGKKMKGMKPKHGSNKNTKKEEVSIFDQLNLASINESEQILTFADGSQEVIDAETAKSVLSTFGSLNDENKAKMVELMTESADGFIKVLEFVSSQILNEGAACKCTKCTCKCGCGKEAAACKCTKCTCKCGCGKARE